MDYLGIRVVMLDSLQRYYKTPGVDGFTDAQKAATLQKLVQDAAKESQLLDHPELTGGAWARLIGDRDPKAIAAFVANPTIKDMVTKLPSIKDAHYTAMGAIAMAAGNGVTLKPMVSGFEDIAQETGLINYKGGQTLSGEIEKYSAQIAAEKGGPVPARKAATPEEKRVIQDTFTTPHVGPVDSKHLEASPPVAAPSPTPPAPAPAAPAAYKVKAGDSVWKIAAGLVGAQHQDTPDYAAKHPAEVLSTMQAIIAQNKDALPKPDHILPEQSISFPPAASPVGKDTQKQR